MRATLTTTYVTMTPGHLSWTDANHDMAAVGLKQAQAFKIQAQSSVLHCCPVGCCVLFWALCFRWGTDKTPGFSEEGKRTGESLRGLSQEKSSEQPRLLGLHKRNLRGDKGAI